MDAPQKHRSRFSAFLFAVLMPGLGHVYLGRARRGLLWFGAILFVLILLRSHLVLWGGEAAFVGFFVLLGFVWLAGVIDAAVQGGSSRVLPAYCRWYVYLGYLVLTPVIFSAFSLAGKKLGTAETYRVPAGSMTPTVLRGDLVMTNRIAYWREKPRAGDVIVFRFPKDESITYLKRVVGLPGDTVEFKNRVLILNGKEVPAKKSEDSSLLKLWSEPGESSKEFSVFQEKLGETTHPVFYRMDTLLNSDFGPVTVPPEKLFVLGDNRDRSSDSRFWGMVPMENVLGRVVYIALSADPETNLVRTERLGKLVE